MAKTPGVPHAFGCFFIVFHLLRDPKIPPSNFNNKVLIFLLNLLSS